VYCGANLSSAFAGILAYAFSRINVGSYAGWRWIFLLEGIITIVVVVGLYFIVDEYPHSSRLLNASQREVAVYLINQDREESTDEKLTVRAVLSLVKNFRYWIFGLIYMFSASAIYSMAYFLPLILNAQMGFSGAMSQVLSTPPSIWGFIIATVVNVVSDRKKMRSPFIIFFSLNVIMGITLMRWGPNTGSQYLGAFFVQGGLFGGLSLTLSFAQNNAPSRVKRSVASGIQLSLGACGGIIGSTIFRSQDAPSYTPGIVTTIGMMVVQIILVVGVTLSMARENKLKRETGKVLEGQASFEYTL
jgi:predicted MFS family arabinose efflux permease